MQKLFYEPTDQHLTPDQEEWVWIAGRTVENPRVRTQVFYTGMQPTNEAWQMRQILK